MCIRDRGSKDTTPAQILSVFENLAMPMPKNHFTIGIVDDVTFTSLPQLSLIHISPQTIRKQKEELIDILDKLKAANFNTVLFQTRTRGDVLLSLIHIFFDHLELDEHDSNVSRRILVEINSRIRFLIDVGLGYLTLNRLSNSCLLYTSLSCPTWNVPSSHGRTVAIRPTARTAIRLLHG